MTKKKAWGYKGYETSINGLTNWIYEIRSKENLIDCGKQIDIYQSHLKSILEYGKLFVPNFKDKGHLTSKTNYIAIKIQSNKKFEHFKEWYIETKINQAIAESLFKQVN